jgi:hypothetical protein
MSQSVAVLRWNGPQGKVPNRENTREKRREPNAGTFGAISTAMVKLGALQNGVMST